MQELEKLLVELFEYHVGLIEITLAHIQLIHQSHK